MNKREYYDIREKIGFTDAIPDYINSLKKIMEVYPPLKDMTLEDAKEWLTERFDNLNMEIQNACVTTDEYRYTPEDEKRIREEIKISLEPLKPDKSPLEQYLEQEKENWFQKMAYEFMQQANEIQKQREENPACLNDTWEVKLDCTCSDLLEGNFHDFIKTDELKPVKPMAQPVNPNYEVDFLTIPIKKNDYIEFT